MRIATNISRNPFGGITISNLELFDWLESGEDQIVGIEFLSERYVRGALVFRKYDPSFFQHHIVNAMDIFDKYPWQNVWFPSMLHRRWKPLLDETKKILLREAPDVVLINGTYGVPWIMAVAAKELGIPIVLRYAGVLQRETTKFSPVVRRRFLVYEREIAAAANAIIFPSKLCRRVVEDEILGRPVENGYVVYNPARSPEGVLWKKPSLPVLAAVGRWSSVKNFQDFIRLHDTLLKEKWSHRARLVTSTTNASELIPETVERVPSMSREEIQHFYAHISLLVVPSIFETFCNVAAEATLVGTPVLVSKNVGFAECLQRAGLGRMVVSSFDDIEKVAQVAKKLCATKITKTEMEKLRAMLAPEEIHLEISHIIKRTIKNAGR